MYETLARYYDQIHASLTADIPFIVGQLQKYGGPAVELGCGTGRLLFPIAEAGIRVTGVDNSPQMLAIASQRLAQKSPDVRKAVTLVQADVQNLAPEGIDKAFVSALLSYNTLLHFREMEVGRLLRGVARLLRPGGRILIDTANPFAITSAVYPDVPVLETSFNDRQTGERIDQWSRSSLDTNEQTLAVSWRFQTEDETSQAQTVEIDYHYLYPHQLVLLLQQAGFTIEEMWGDYESEPFEEESDRLILLARLQETKQAPAHQHK